MSSTTGTLPKHDHDGHHHRAELSPAHKHFVAATGEFVGTFLFLLFAYAGNLQYVQQASSQAEAGGNSASTVYYVANVYSFSLLINVWAFYRISGGLFNPAVTLGACLAGAMPWVRGACLVPAQLIASMCAGGVVSAMFPGNVATANSTLSSDTSVAQGLFIEMFSTSLLVFVVLMLVAERSKDTFIAPLGIGLALYTAMLATTYYTGGSLNPARSFGCAVAGRSFPGYHWIYWLGPLMGAAIAAGFYHFLKRAHYEEVNPNRDSTEDFSLLRSHDSIARSSAVVSNV